jgi:hypothetical protein
MKLVWGVISLAMLAMLVFMLSILATAQTPLDLLQPRSAPVQSVSLSGLSPTSAHAIGPAPGRPGKVLLRNEAPR